MFICNIQNLSSLHNIIPRVLEEFNSIVFIIVKYLPPQSLLIRYFFIIVCKVYAQIPIWRIDFTITFFLLKNQNESVVY